LWTNTKLHASGVTLSAPTLCPALLLTASLVWPGCSTPLSTEHRPWLAVLYCHYVSRPGKVTMCQSQLCHVSNACWKRVLKKE